MALGEAATVAQLAGLSAGALIGLIVRAANTARMHKHNCNQFAQHVKMIGNLLDQLRVSELEKYPETREPLEQLEDALRRAYLLINSCQERSYLYLIAMGWSIVYQFRRAQEEIDRYLRIIPLIALLDNARVKRRLEDIQRDQREYTLDDNDRKVQAVILNPQPSKNDRIVLIKNLSRSYPNLPVDAALKSESKKLRVELQHSQANMDAGQFEVIQRLIEVTEDVASSLSAESSPVRSAKKLEVNVENDSKLTESHKTERLAYFVCVLEFCRDIILDQLRARVGKKSGKRIYLDAVPSLPCVCWCSYFEITFPLSCSVKTFFWPCGTFAKVASVATGKQITSAEACNEMMAYSLVLSCCCYTCCIRQKLRRVLNIKFLFTALVQGGAVDDFFSHLLCCCCALVQEWREVEIRGVQGATKPCMNPPPSQNMEY
nr:protein MID1-COMPLEMENTING ACTIVITY 1-like [Ipomoea batatas]